MSSPPDPQHPLDERRRMTSERLAILRTMAVDRGSIAVTNHVGGTELVDLLNEVGELRGLLYRIGTTVGVDAQQLRRMAQAAPSSQDAAPAAADPLEGHVEVDWDRPLDEWETGFKDELFLWGPFFRGLGHGHAYLDANARYALARIAGILHRAAPPADAAPGLRAEIERLRRALLDAYVLLPPDRLHLLRPDTDAVVSETTAAALGSTPPRSGEAGT